MPSVETIQTSAVAQHREPEWWALCREKHAAGASIDSLAYEFGRKPKQIALVVGDGTRRRHERERLRSYHVPVLTKRTSHNTSVVEPRKPREVKRIIADPQTIRAAAEKFARGKITRERFMGIVSAGAPANG